MTERGEALHLQIQAVLLGERLGDCARAIALSLAATAGLCAPTPEAADALIDILAGQGKLDVRSNWASIVAARNQCIEMHGIDESGVQ